MKIIGPLLLSLLTITEGCTRVASLPQQSPQTAPFAARPVTEEEPIVGYQRLPLVVSTGDGDTLRVNRDGETLTIRVACIDAAESDQSGGAAAADRLQELLPHGQAVQVREVELDRYGRTVAELFLGNQSIGVILVREGQAVVYDQFLDSCAETRELYLEAEAEAQANRVGIWAEPNPIMPWEWRQGEQRSAEGRARSEEPRQPQGSGDGNTGGERDCKDFATQAEAQRFFESLPGDDPHQLDRDGDGRVCEGLP